MGVDMIMLTILPRGHQRIQSQTIKNKKKTLGKKIFMGDLQD